MKSNEIVVVTRHKTLVQHLRETGIIDGEVKVLSHVEDEDVATISGRTVVGVLPMHLAALCGTYICVPLKIPSDLRGKELTLDEVRKFAGEPEYYEVLRKF